MDAAWIDPGGVGRADGGCELSAPRLQHRRGPGEPRQNLIAPAGPVAPAEQNRRLVGIPAELRRELAEDLASRGGDLGPLGLKLVGDRAMSGASRVEVEEEVVIGDAHPLYSAACAWA